MTQEEIEQMVLAHINQMTRETHITVFLADFCNEYGVICPVLLPEPCEAPELSPTARGNGGFGSTGK